MRKTTAAQKKAKKTEALADSVHRVVAAYIANLGGRVVVSGPIQIQQWPGDGKHRFTVAIKCTGFLPVQKDGWPKIKGNVTQYYISRDRIRKGNTKLTEGDVKAIRTSLRRRRATQSALALKYGVDQTTISWIALGKSWRVPPTKAWERGKKRGDEARERLGPQNGSNS